MTVLIMTMIMIDLWLYFINVHHCDDAESMFVCINCSLTGV